MGAVVDVSALPVSDAFLSRVPSSESRVPLQTASGDDYELCLCIPPERLDAARARLDLPLSVIGRITAEPGLRLVDAAGATITLETTAYRHFP
ncbi:MAG: hypothetical protein ACLGI7_01665 [Gammaproteobacteria bacterium]